MVEVQPKTFGLDLGNEVPVLVLLAGFPDDHEMWKPVVDAFKNEYHMVSITTPDFDSDGLRTKWGYTPQEVVHMISAAIDKHLGTRKNFILVQHDWGCLWGNLYISGPNANRVRAVVALDVGSNGISDEEVKAGKQDPDTKGILWTLPYQWLFAFTFWIGVRVSPTVAEMLLSVFWRGLMPYIGPLHSNFNIQTDMPRPWSELRWWMTYPYFQVWSAIFTGNMKNIGRWYFPKVPVFFGYGVKKRAFFHSETYFRRLQATEGCVGKSYDCSHWITHEKPDELIPDVRMFLDANKGNM